MKTVHFFLGADLRSGHNGLTLLAKKKKVDLQDLSDDEAVVFINRARTGMKAYSYNGVLSYVKTDPKRGIDMDSLNEIPRAFSTDGRMDYTIALRTALEKKLGKPGKFKDLEVL